MAPTPAKPPNCWRLPKGQGDAIETAVFQRLTRLLLPTNVRRFDVASEGDISDNALPLARSADIFVALRPNGRSNEPEGLNPNLLYGTGRHLAGSGRLESYCAVR